MDAIRIEEMSRIGTIKGADLNVTDCAGNPILDNRLILAHMPTQKDAQIPPLRSTHATRSL